jgi:hypothetical protein
MLVAFFSPFRIIVALYLIYQLGVVAVSCPSMLNSSPNPGLLYLSSVTLVTEVIILKRCP